MPVVSSSSLVPDKPTVNYLRISLIDRCNFRCQYCVPDHHTIVTNGHEDWLTIAELLWLVKAVFIPVGITRFRLTGGEPLLRPGLTELVRGLANTAGVEDIALTTNGFALDQLAQPLYDSGLRRINISLDSLDPQIFHQITGRDLWERVWQGILAAHAVGFDPLKLNVVVIPGINDHEVMNLAALSLTRQWHIRFIEFMPIGNEALFQAKGWVASEQLRSQIREHFGLTSGSVAGNGPADVFQIPGALGTVGFISQMSECFCDRCNRLRLSADGWLRPCLLNESEQVDLRTLLHQHRDPDILQAHIRQLLHRKAEVHFKDRDAGTTSTYRRTMSQIGG